MAKDENTKSSSRKSAPAVDTPQHRFVLKLAQRVAAKLNKLIDQGHENWAFTIILTLSIIKDIGFTILLDKLLKLLGIGFIPLIADVGPLFVSAVLFYFAWGKGWFMGTKAKIWIWIAGGFVEVVDVIGFVPTTTISTLLTWRLIRKKAKEAERHMEKLHTKTLAELESLDEEYADYGEQEEVQASNIRSSSRRPDVLANSGPENVKTPKRTNPLPVTQK